MPDSTIHFYVVIHTKENQKHLSSFLLFMEKKCYEHKQVQVVEVCARVGKIKEPCGIVSLGLLFKMTSHWLLFTSNRH